MNDFSTEGQDSGVVKAAAEWDPSGGVNPEWLWQKPEPKGFDQSEGSGISRFSEAVLTLVLAGAFLFFAVLSW